MDITRNPEFPNTNKKRIPSWINFKWVLKITIWNTQKPTQIVEIEKISEYSGKIL